MPEDVIVHYTLNNITTPDGYIYCKIQKGMYGLPRAGSLPSNYSKNAYKRTVTARAKPHKAYGNTIPARSASLLSSMISG
jgi:hypothetical protein